MDADQEMVALGICNFMSSFVSAMPITGSFSRTAVNSASGRALPDITSGPEVQKIFKIRTVRKLDVVLPESKF